MKTQKIIKYYSASKYGVINNYIADKELAKTISKITRQITIGHRQMQGLIELGYTFKEVLPKYSTS